MHIASVGIDLRKTTFHLVALGERNKVLVPAQFVKPYRKSNKNDFLDAEAIAEAVTKQNMRFAQLKTQEQLDRQAMHRVRDRLVQRSTAESILHLEAGYIYADCRFINFNPLAVRRWTITFSSVRSLAGGDQ